MEQQENEPVTTAATSSYSGWALLARFHWSITGPCLMAGLLIPVYRSTEAVGWAELALMINTVSMAGCRYMEWKSGGATTLYNEATTEAHVQKYTIYLLIVVSLAWLAARLLGRG